MSNVDHNYNSEDEIDLRELFGKLWRERWTIILVTFVTSCAGVLYALMLPNIYQATALLAPAQTEGNRQISSQLSGLANFAGLDLGGGGEVSRTVLAMEILQSRAFLTDFIHRHNLSIPLWATSEWDDTRDEWIVDREVYDTEAKQWLEDDQGLSLEPTDWDLVEAFRELLNVSENKDTGMVTVSIKSQSPIAARDWVGKLIYDINQHIREQDIAESESRIAYLEDKLRQTSIAGMQQMFYQLIETETRTVMLASAVPEYVLKTIDPPVVPQEESEPKRVLIVIFATLFGGLLGIFVVLSKRYGEQAKKHGV